MQQSLYTDVMSNNANINSLPFITFSEDCDYDTVWSVVKGWVVTVTLDDGTLSEGVAQWDGTTVLLTNFTNGDIIVRIDPDRVVSIAVA